MYVKEDQNWGRDYVFVSGQWKALQFSTGFEIVVLYSKGERIYQDYFGDFFLRVIWKFISHLEMETILKTIFSENNCQIENGLQNSLQTENKP